MNKPATAKKQAKKSVPKAKQSGLSNAQKKEWAKSLYLQGELSQKEIALKVDVSENTMSKWVNENEHEWDKHRKSLLTSKTTILRRLYDMLDTITAREAAAEEPDAKLADQLVKLTTAIKNMETETSVAEIMDVAKKFIDWMMTLDPDMALIIGNHFDKFIKQRLKGF